MTDSTDTGSIDIIPIPPDHQSTHGKPIPGTSGHTDIPENDPNELLPTPPTVGQIEDIVRKTRLVGLWKADPAAYDSNSSVIKAFSSIQSRLDNGVVGDSDTVIELTKQVAELMQRVQQLEDAPSKSNNVFATFFMGAVPTSYQGDVITVHTDTPSKLTCQYIWDSATENYVRPPWNQPGIVQFFFRGGQSYRGFTSLEYKTVITASNYPDLTNAVGYNAGKFFYTTDQAGGLLRLENTTHPYAPGYGQKSVADMANPPDELQAEQSTPSKEDTQDQPFSMVFPAYLSY